MSAAWFWRLWALACLITAIVMVPSLTTQVAMLGLVIALVALIAGFIEGSRL